ncbi:MAG TPA: hypothetical protein VLH15_05540 [Dehalococcoidales bacterium]|nr:hypothetical protein [Dehalococcoidales bacterium]
MEYLIMWLTSSWLGILFGLFPGFASAASILYEAILVDKKKPARWLYNVFLIDSEHPEVALLARGPRRTRKMTWYISIGYVMLLLGFYHYIGRIYYSVGDIASIIVGETSFPVFLLLTWLLPVYFLKRYLKKLKPGGEVDRFTLYDHN